MIAEADAEIDRGAIIGGDKRGLGLAAQAWQTVKPRWLPNVSAWTWHASWTLDLRKASVVIVPAYLCCSHRLAGAQPKNEMLMEVELLSDGVPGDRQHRMAIPGSRRVLPGLAPG
jgi:hypothetical protein